MNRVAFLRASAAVAASPIVVPLLQPTEAEAQFAVFDAANYQQAILQVTKDVGISANTAATAIRALQTLQQLQQMNGLNIQNIYNLAMPYMHDIVNAAKINVAVPLTADKLLVQFANAFPSWSPNFPYASLYSNALLNARKAMATAAQEAQAIDNRNAQQDAVVDDLVNMPPKSITDAMTIGNYLGASVVQSVNSLSSTLGHQFNDQGTFLQAMYASQEATRRSPGMAMLISTFSSLPSRLAPVH